jgi:hypothetical protein
LSGRDTDKSKPGAAGKSSWGKKVDSINCGANCLAESRLKLDEDAESATGSNPVRDEKSTGANRRAEKELKLDEGGKFTAGTNPVLEEKSEGANDEEGGSSKTKSS